LLPSAPAPAGSPRAAFPSILVKQALNKSALEGMYWSNPEARGEGPIAGGERAIEPNPKD